MSAHCPARPFQPTARSSPPRRKGSSVARWVLAAVSLVLAATSAQAQSRLPRDEGKARRFVHCMVVSNFFVAYLTRHDPGNEGLPGFRAGRLPFALAAALVSDDAFMLRSREESLRHVARIAEADRETGSRQMDSEAMACAGVMEDEVVPMLLRAREGR